MSSSNASNSSIMQAHSTHEQSRSASDDSSCRLKSDPSMASGERQHHADRAPTHLQINRLPPQPIGPSLVSPTIRAFQNLTVQTPKEKQKQKRRKGIYGLEELTGDNTTVTSQSQPPEEDGRLCPGNTNNADTDDDVDEADVDDGFSRRHPIQYHSIPHTPSKLSGPSHLRQLVDLDRDSYGRRLRAHRRQTTTSKQADSCVPLPERQHSCSDNGTAPDLHHDPVASSHLKRKRQSSSSPVPLPPVFQPYTRTKNPDFNVFSGFLLYPELCLHLATRLPVGDLISLYAISRDFHTIIDARFTTVILSIATRRARESSRVFPFRCYARLCRTDPAARLPHPDPRKAAAHIPRMVPSFRWLKMVMYREAVVHEIMAVMAEDGVPLPRRCGLAIKKMWFLMDIPDNARRFGYIHSRRLVSDLDLYFIVCTIVKMDMRFNDPVGPEKRDGLRRLLLAQRSLSVWLRVLKGEMWSTKLEVLRAWLRCKYDPLPTAEQFHGRPVTSIFGVPFAECGKLSEEYWGLLPPGHPAAQQLDARGNKMLLMRPDQLVLREVIRRGLRCRGHYIKCLLYGYIDLRTLRNMEPRAIHRRVPEWDVLEYGVDGLWGTGVGAVTGGQTSSGQQGNQTSDGDDIGTDDLLDLGPANEVSIWCVKREEMGTTERRIRKDLSAISARMMTLWDAGGHVRVTLPKVIEKEIGHVSVEV